MGNDAVEEFEIDLISANGPPIPAVFRLDDDVEPATLTVQYAGQSLGETGSDYFEAFCKIRTRLEGKGLKPSCYGASENVYPSGMSRGMGGGLKAYRLFVGQIAKKADLVDIFGTGPDAKPATVEEQDAYYRRWLDSIEK